MRLPSKHVGYRIVMAASAALAIVLPGTSVQAYSPTGRQYHFQGSIISRQHGSACLGEDEPAESRLTRYDYGIGFTSSTSTSVVCPIQRRNTESWGHWNTNNTGSIAYTLQVQVKLPYGGSISCQPYVMSTTQGLYWGQQKWACSTWGGCNSSSTYTGVAQLYWSSPFGSPERNAANMAVQCYNSTSSNQINWYYTDFKPNSDH